MRVPGTDGRADKRFALLGRYSSEIRTGCANERPSGSVRGAPGNWCPFRDHQLRIMAFSSKAFTLKTSGSFGQRQKEKTQLSLGPTSERRPTDDVSQRCRRRCKTIAGIAFLIPLHK